MKHGAHSGYKDTYLGHNSLSGFYSRYVSQGLLGNMNQTPVGSRAAAFASKDPPPGSSGHLVTEEEGVADLPCDLRSGDTPF